MKHKRLAATVLATALWLTGCGSAAAPAAPAGSGAASQSAADTAVQTAQKDRITEQFTLEKTIQLYEWGSAQKLTIHVPQLVCDGPDAAYLNDELAAMYAADFRQYEDSPEIEPQQDEWCPETYINWDAYWYGDCVSLVVFRYDGGSDPGYSRGWCFDFATEKQVSVTEMLQRMGLDPDAVQQQMLRGAMQTFDRRMAQGGYYEGLRSGGNLASMRLNTLENNQLDDLCLLLPEQDRLVLRGVTYYFVENDVYFMRGKLYGCHGRHPGADRYLRQCFGADGGNPGHHHPPPHAGDHRMGHGLRHPAGTGPHLPHPWHL